MSAGACPVRHQPVHGARSDAAGAATGSVECGRIGGRRKPLLAGDEDDLRRLVEARKGITLAERRAEIVARGGPVVSLWTVWSMMRRHARASLVSGLSLTTITGADKTSDNDAASHRTGSVEAAFRGCDPERREPAGPTWITQSAAMRGARGASTRQRMRKADAWIPLTAPSASSP